MPFTTRQIESLKPGPKRLVITETGVAPDLRGLQLWVSPAGAKSWTLRYKADGKTRYLRLGDFPHVSLAEAHRRVGEFRRQIREGTDPKVEREAVRAARAAEEEAAPTVRRVYEDFRDEYLRKKRKRPGDAEAVLENHVIGVWGDRRADGIKTREIVELVRGIRDSNGPRIAEVVKGLTGQMFNHAALTGLLDVSPAAKLPVIGTRWVQRERVLDDDEIRTVWTKLDDAAMEPPARLALRLLLVTGQRRQELALAKWADIDWKAKTWTIPPENAKNGRQHFVPLSPLAVRLLHELEALKRPGLDTYVVPSRLRENRPIDPMALTRAVRKNLKHFGMAAAPWTPHDLRRTVATRLAELGIARLIVSKVLNHVDEGVTAGYDRHDYLPEMRDALNRWAKALADILAGKPARKRRVRK